MSRKKSSVECICPRCGVTHKLNMMWIGRGKPKKYCPNCKSIVSSSADVGTHQTPTNWPK